LAAGRAWEPQPPRAILRPARRQLSADRKLVRSECCLRARAAGSRTPFVQLTRTSLCSSVARAQAGPLSVEIPMKPIIAVCRSVFAALCAGGFASPVAAQAASPAFTPPPAPQTQAPGVGKRLKVFDVLDFDVF